VAQRPVRVFVSHSAHKDQEPATLLFLEALVARLTAESFEPLTDQKDLRAGDEWLQRLYGWMGLCDAAVILLSPRAVTRENSTWVPRETNLLLWRKALDPRFVVIPVLVGGLTKADLKTNPFLADARLSEIQFAPTLDDAGKIDEIVSVLKAKLGSAFTRLTFDPLRVHVEDCIQRFAPQASVDNALLEHYQTEAWQPLVPPGEKLSLHLVRGATSEAVDPVIRDVTLGSQGKANLGALLFDALYPLRLPAENACRLLTLCHDQEGRGAVLVNTHDPWAIRMLLRAASGLTNDDFLRTWQIVELPDGWGDDDVEEVRLALARELAERILGTNGWEDLSDNPDPVLRLAEQYDSLHLYLQEARRQTGAPLVATAAYTPRWAERAAALVAQFPTVVFLFWTGDALPSSTPANTDCVPLEPLLPKGHFRGWELGYRLKFKLFGGSV
jgi:hypothetical protein